MSLEDCKYLYREMSEKDMEMERTVLRDVEPSLNLDGILYSKVHRIILNSSGVSINMRLLEIFGYNLYTNGLSYILYKNRKVVYDFECPPDWHSLVKTLSYNSNEILFSLYHIFLKALRLIRKSIRAAAYAAADAAYAAAYAAADAAYAVGAAGAYAAAAGADAAYAADAAGAAGAYAAADAADAAYAAADAYKHMKNAFRKLIKFKKEALKKL